MSASSRFSLADTEQAQAAAQRLYDSVHPRLTALLPEMADIRHVGATAICGCLTKGDLDIVVRVAPQHFVGADVVLAMLYSRNEGSARTSDFSAFEDPASTPPLGVQLVAIGSPFDTFHIFVEALQQSQRDLADYNGLKRAYDGASMLKYREAKAAFVEIVIARHLLRR